MNNPFKMKYSLRMEYITCTSCGLPNKRSNVFNRRLTDTICAASKEY